MEGANGQGETVDEVIENLDAAIGLMLEVAREERAKEVSPRAQRRVVTVG